MGLLHSRIAVQAEVLSAELQTVFAARLQEVFQPLRDLVAAVQGWSDQVSSLWELMEDIGGRLALVDSSTSGKHDESGPLVMAGGKDVNVDDGAGARLGCAV